MGSLAWHKMGAGKTLSALWLARHNLNKVKQLGIKNAKFVVIVPKTAISTWKTECYNQTPDIYRDMVIYPYSQLHNAIKSLKYMDVRFLAWDEIHYLKSPDTDRIKYASDFMREIHRLNKFEHGRIFTGTGTPMPNNASEFYTSWAMCCSPNLEESANRMLDMTRFENWRNAFTNKKDVNWVVGKKRPKEQQRRGHASKYVGVANEDKLSKILSEYVHFVQNYGDLPPRQEIAIDLGLEDDKLLADANIEEPEAYMALVERLSRAKTPHMIDWVKEFMHTSIGEQLVVFAMNRHPIEQLKEHFPKHVRLITGGESNADRAQNLKDFQEGKVLILAMTYAAGSEALNLQNARVSLYHGYSWTDAKIKQAIARTDRQGQLRDTLHYFLTSGANDQRLLGNVRAKEEATDKVESLMLKNKSLLDTLI